MTQSSPDDHRWQAVMARDRAADGAFVFAVATTGIYCRPSCPARRPNRANLRFFPEPAAARAAGFRACLRCDPDGPGAAGLAARTVAVAAAMIATAVAEGAPAPDLATLAARAGYGTTYFHRLFRRETGLTPAAYARALRQDGVEAALAGGTPVTEALHAAGYSASAFYAAAGARRGMAPAARRDGGRGLRIRQTTVRTSLGPLLVAATDAGLCAVQFGTDPEALEHWLKARFPAAEILPADAALDALARAVVAQVEHPAADPSLPLDLQGTAFQARVWQALQAIPLGATASYAEIAARLGAPTASRAVAGACAANPVAVVVPCHRVLRADGGLSGYRWGRDRKAALLAREAAAPGQPPDQP